MDSLKVTRSGSGSVVTAVLNRPDALNSLNKELLLELKALFDSVSTDSGVRVLILTGAGRAFCAGADLVNFDTTDPAEAAEQAGGELFAHNMERYFYPMVRAMLACDKPIICAINGIAAGGGVGLGLMGDLVLAAESASFRVVFGPQLGLIPDLGASWLVPHLIGRARANGLGLLGDSLPAAKAEQWGLVWEVLPDDQLMARATELAERIADGAIGGIKAVSRAHDHALQASFEEQLDYEVQVQRHFLAQPEFAEGRQAFVEKRKPDFRSCADD